VMTRTPSPRSLLKMPAPVRTEVSVTGPEAADREGIRW
jgi:hypothetical protein